MKEYPKHKYKKAAHAKGFDSRIVHSKAQEDALGKDWVNSPAAIGIETHPADPNIFLDEPVAEPTPAKPKRGEA